MNAEVKAICRERCAEVGDPPCYRFDDEKGIPFLPCPECLADVLGTPTKPEAIDPEAAIRDLF